MSGRNQQRTILVDVKINDTDALGRLDKVADKIASLRAEILAAAQAQSVGGMTAEQWEEKTADLMKQQKAAQSQYSEQKTAIEKLSQVQLDSASATDAQRIRLAQLEQELSDNAKELSSYQKMVKDGIDIDGKAAKKTVELKEKIKGLKEEQKDLTTNIDKNKKANKALEGSNDQLKAQLSILLKQYNAMSREQRESTEAGKNLRLSIKGINDELKGSEGAVGIFNRSVGDYRNAITSAFSQIQTGSGTGLGVGSSALSAAGAGLSFINPAAGTALTAAAGALSLVDKLAQQTKESVGGLIDETEQFLGVSREAAEGIGANIQSIANVFELERKELLQAANTTSKAFGISFEESFALIEKSLLAGANLNGDFLDGLKEYPDQFKAAGASAEQFFVIATKGAKEGIFSDKALDAVKEGLISIRELTPATSAAIEKLGLSIDDIQTGLRDGSKSTIDVLVEIAKRMRQFPEISTEVGTAFADIFRGAGEDAGPRFIEMLGTIDQSLDSLVNQTARLTNIQKLQLQVEKESSQAKIELNKNLLALGTSSQTAGKQFETSWTKALSFVAREIGRVKTAFLGVTTLFSAYDREQMKINIMKSKSGTDEALTELQQASKALQEGGSFSDIKFDVFRGTPETKKEEKGGKGEEVSKLKNVESVDFSGLLEPYKQIESAEIKIDGLRDTFTKDQLKRLEDFNQRSIQLTGQRVQMEIDAETQKADAINNILSLSGQLFDENTFANVAISIAEAVVNTWGAANAALKQGSLINPIYGIAQAGLTAAVGIANVAKMISAQSQMKGRNGAGPGGSISVPAPGQGVTTSVDSDGRFIPAVGAGVAPGQISGIGQGVASQQPIEVSLSITELRNKLRQVDYKERNLARTGG